MSIILEALKKAEREGLTRNKKKEILEKNDSLFTNPLNRPKRYLHRYLLGLGLFIPLGLFFGWLFHNNRQSGISGLNGHEISRPGEIYYTKTGRPILRVAGIVWDEEEPIALVNGEFLKKGDEVFGTKVEDIQPDEVTFLYREEEFTIAVE